MKKNTKIKKKKIVKKKSETKETFKELSYKWAAKNKCGPIEMIAHLELVKGEIVNEIIKYHR
ncbi:MAG: hypothetical protein CMI54_08760 [Parcubacteria group bacterium]|jgi:hypothetical protein|nr:hypothetical protein [Parcubacteria group bacterium]|tara:strand:+ start:559 stop:744 length:186 start_codon:yes stop_codon:yes gene_type:complete